MRKAILVLGIVGGLAAGFLGMKWLKDANDMKEILQTVRDIGGDTAEVDKLITAAYILLASMVAGIIGGVMAFAGKSKAASGLLIAAAIAPVVFAPKALAFTFLLLIAGILSLTVKTEPEPAKVKAAF